MTERIPGKVKWFNLRDGYGFILPDAGGKDVFVHRDKVEKSGLKPEDLKEGAAVSFVIREFKGRNQAEELQITG